MGLNFNFDFSFLNDVSLDKLYKDANSDVNVDLASKQNNNGLNSNISTNSYGGTSSSQTESLDLSSTVSEGGKGNINYNSSSSVNAPNVADSNGSVSSNVDVKTPYSNSQSGTSGVNSNNTSINNQSSNNINVQTTNTGNNNTSIQGANASSSTGVNASGGSMNVNSTGGGMANNVGTNSNTSIDINSSNNMSVNNNSNTSMPGDNNSNPFGMNSFDGMNSDGNNDSNINSNIYTDSNVYQNTEKYNIIETIDFDAYKIKLDEWQRIYEETINAAQKDLDDLTYEYSMFLKSDNLDGLIKDEFGNWYTPDGLKNDSMQLTAYLESHGYDINNTIDYRNGQEAFNKWIDEEYAPLFDRYLHDAIGKTYNEYVQKKIELETSITELGSQYYTLRQEQKVLPYLEIAESDDYKTWLAKREGNMPEITMEKDFFWGDKIYVNGVETDPRNIDPMLLGYAIESGNITYNSTIKGMSSVVDDANFDYLTPEQRNMYSYLYETYGDAGPEKAEEYLKAITDSINQAKAREEVEAIIERCTIDGKFNYATFETLVVEGIGDGVFTFGEGLSNIFNKEGEISVTQYSQMYLMNEITNSRNIYIEEIYTDIYNSRGSTYAEVFAQNIYNNIETGEINLEYAKAHLTDYQYKELEARIASDNSFATTIYGGGYELGSAFGNMAPSMVLAILTKGASLSLGASATTAGTIASVLGNVTMGVSAAGNSYNQALIKGNNRGTAYLYGMLSGLSETTLGMLLGNIPGLNADAAFSLKGILSEGIEEGLQTYIEAGLNSAILGEPVNLSDYHGEALKAFLYGMIMSGITTGTQTTYTLGVGSQYANLSYSNLLDFYKLLNYTETGIVTDNNGNAVFVINSDTSVDQATINKIKGVFPGLDVVQKFSDGSSSINGPVLQQQVWDVQRVISSSDSLTINDVINGCHPDVLKVLSESDVKTAIDKGYMITNESPATIRSNPNIINYAINNATNKETVQSIVDSSTLSSSDLRRVLPAAVSKGYTITSESPSYIRSDFSVASYIVNNSTDRDAIQSALDVSNSYVLMGGTKINTFEQLQLKKLLQAAIKNGYTVSDTTSPKLMNIIRNDLDIIKYIINNSLDSPSVKYVIDHCDFSVLKFENLEFETMIQEAIGKGYKIDAETPMVIRNNENIIEYVNNKILLQYTGDYSFDVTKLLNNYSPELLDLLSIETIAKAITNSFVIDKNSPDTIKNNYRILDALIRTSSRLQGLVNMSTFIENFVRNLSSFDDINIFIENYDFSILTQEKLLSLIEDKKIGLSNMMKLSATNSSFFVKFQSIIFNYFSTELNVEKERLQQCYKLFGYEIFNYLDNARILKVLSLPSDKYNMIMEIFNSSILDQNKITAVYDSLIQVAFGKDNPEIISLFQRIQADLDLSDFTTTNIYFERVKNCMLSLYQLGGIDYLKKITKITEFTEYLGDKNYTIEYFFSNPVDILVELCTDVVAGHVDFELLHMFSNTAIAHMRELYAQERKNIYNYDVVLPTRPKKDLLVKRILGEMSLEQLEYLFKSIDSNSLSESQKEFIFGQKNDQNINLLMECLKFRKNPGEYQSNASKDIMVTVKKGLKTLNEIIDILYNNNVLNKYANGAEYELYVPQRLGSFALMVLADIDLNLALSDKNHKSLLEVMKKYGFLGWNSNMFDRLLSKTSITYDDGVVASLISNFSRILYHLQKNDSTAKIKMSQYLEGASMYGKDYIKTLLFGETDFMYLKTNPGPNTATSITGNDRIKKALEYIPNMYQRQYVTVPPINELISTSSGKALKVILGDVTSMINFTYGERTGACMRIGGVAKGMFDFAMVNSNGFHIRFEDSKTGEFVSRVTAFRNGNTLFFNQLRESLMKYEYSNADLCEICEKLAFKIIEMTKDSGYPIETVMINSYYAMKSSGKVGMNFGIDPFKGYEDFFRNRGFDASPYADVGKKETIVLATTAKDKDYADIKFGQENATLYPVLRNPVAIYKGTTDNSNQSVVQVINKINQLNLINQVLIKDPTCYTELLEGDISFAITGDDWYIYIDKNGQIQIKVLDNIPDFRKQAAASEIEKYMDVVVGEFDVTHQQEVSNIIEEYLSNLLG